MTENMRQNSDSEQEIDFNTGQAVLRLIVGLTLEGTDELSRRLREWETRITQEHEPPSSSSTGTQSKSLSEGERLYYALIGMSFAARQRVERDMTEWLSSPGRVMQGLIDLTNDLSENPLLRPLVQPIKEQAEAVSQHVHDEIERWVAIGQAEEQRSRAVARIAVPEVIDEVLEMLADNPELQDLIQQQSVGLAGEVVDSVREVTVTADSVVEAIARRILGRKPRRQLPPPDNRLLADSSQNGHKEPDRDDSAR